MVTQQRERIPKTMKNYGSLVTNFKYEKPRFVDVSDDDSLADYSYICNDRGVKVYSLTDI